MSQPFTFQAANNRSPLRIGQVIFTVLALLSFALGSVLLSLVWFGVGVTTTGKDFGALIDRKSTRLNSSHGYISYAVFCLKKKKKFLQPVCLHPQCRVVGRCIDGAQAHIC